MLYGPKLHSPVQARGLVKLYGAKPWLTRHRPGPGQAVRAKASLTRHMPKSE